MSRDRIVWANGLAWAFWRAQLPASPGHAYLAGRGIDPDAAAAAGHPAGWAPPAWSSMTTALRRAGVPDAVMVEAGLAFRGRSGDLLDRWRGRVVMAIRDRWTGDVLGFTGRTVGPPDPDGARWVNTPGTAAFAKSDALHAPWPPLAAADGVVLVEGALDAAAVASAGSWAAMAACGTALTLQHALAAHAESEGLRAPILLAYDADPAGAAAAARAAALLTAIRPPRHGLAVVALPPGSDPADLLAADGPAALHRLLASARPPALAERSAAGHRGVLPRR